MEKSTKNPAFSESILITKSKFSLNRVKKHRKMNPVEAELLARRHQKIQSFIHGFQPLKTFLAVVFWVVSAPLTVGIISPYVSYTYGQMMLNATAVSAGILLHLWPPKTSPWRTLAWAYLIMCITGAVMLTWGQGRVSLTVATVVAWLFILARVGQMGRKTWVMYQDWKWMR